MSSTVLVTGARGYAGGAIAQALRNAGHEVLTAGRGKQDTFPLDLTRPDEVRQLVLPRGISACFHAAAWHEVQCRYDPAGAYVANVAATRALMETTSAADVGRLVYVSTFHVFGRPSGNLREDTLAQPANDYGFSHRYAEDLVTRLFPAHGGQSHVLRPANLYGQPSDWARFDRWSLAPFDFVRQAVNSGCIRLLSDGTPIRNYTSVHALGAAALGCLDGQLGPLTHLPGRHWSMLELANLAAQACEQVTGRPVQVELGQACAPETAWTFQSSHWPTAQDADAIDMRAFLEAVARHEQGPK